MDGQGHQGQGNDSNPLELLYVGFNQDSACFAVGTSAGFRVYNCEPFRETFCRGFSNGGIGVVAMLFRCQVLAIVGGGAFPKYPPNKVMIWDDHQAKCIGELSFRTQVRSVRLRRDMVVVALEHRVLVYAFADLRLLLQVETLSNPQGLVAVSCDADSTVLACLGLHPGQVRIELYDRHQTKFIDAHTSSLQAMSLSLDGRRLATASQKGTLIRVWSTADRQLLHELRRGADPACIYSLALSRDSNWLAATSDKGTVHVFGLGPNHHHHTSSGAAGDGSTGTAGSSGKGGAAGSEQQQGGGSGRGGASVGGDAGSVTEVAGSPDERGAHGSGQQGTPQSRTGSSGGGLFGFVKSSLSGLVPALPAAISPLLPKYFHSEWSFAQFRLPDDKCRGKVLVGFGSDPGVLYLITSGGSFYKVVFDTVKGGVAQQVDWANFLVPSSMGSA